MRGYRRKFVTGALVSVLLVAATACGSDDSSDTAPEGGDASTTVPSTAAVSATTSGSATTAGSATTGVATSTTGATDAGDDHPQGGTLAVLQSGAEPTTLDPSQVPLVQVGASQAPLAYSLYDNLVRVDYKTGEVIPRIAESVEPNADATQWTIKLREGVTFTDGTPYDAAAVIFNWDRQKDEALAGRCRSTVMAMSYVATDSRTITVTLTEPRAAFPVSLADCLSGVASPKALQEFGAEYGTSPEKTVGAGPFMFTEWAHGDHVTFVRNPDFWDNPRPYLDEIVFRWSPDQTQIGNALLSGATDVGNFSLGAAADVVAQIKSTDGLGFIDSVQQGGFAVGFNTQRPPLDDPRVRKALVLAFDPDDFNEKVGGGALTMADTYFDDTSAFYDPAVAQKTNDLAAAQALIDEYVAEKGGPVQLTILGSSTLTLLNTTLQQQWSRLQDVDVQIDGTVTSSTALGTGDYQIGFGGLGGANDPETFYANFSSTSVRNVLKFSDPEMDAALTELRGATDAKRQKELYSEVTGLLFDQAWYLLTYRPTFTYGYNSAKFDGFSMHDGAAPDYTTLYSTSDG